MARKPRLGTRYTRLKNQIVKSLQEKGVYDPTDDILIEDLLFNLKISDDAKADIIARGVSVNVVRDPEKPPLYQTNPSVSIYSAASKNISALATKVGITVQERSKLKLKAEEEDPLAALISGSGSKYPPR